MALSLGGCASRSSEPHHVQGPHRSIKDSDERAASMTAPPRTRTAHAEPTHMPKTAAAIRVAANPMPQPTSLSQSTTSGQTSDREPSAPRAALAAPRPSPPNDVKAVEKSTEKSVELSSAVTQAPLKAVEPAQSEARPLLEARPIADARRGGGPAVVALAPVAAAPIAVAPVAPAPMSATPVAVSPLAVKADEKTRETLKLVDVWMRQGNIGNARTALADAVRTENAELLFALAATYDPVALQRFPKLAEKADSDYAVSFYKLAIAKGSTEAKDALAKMQAFLAKK